MFGKSNIFLIGPMGSGKTAVGKQLAKLLRAQFLDSDAEIVRRTGADINFIFEKEGEAGFRLRERDALEELTRHDNIVLATGGGAIVTLANRVALRERGTVVYLETTLDQQVQRVRHGQARPLLANADPAIRLAELMAIRQPLYTEIADIVVSTSGRKVHSVAEEIVRKIKEA